MIGIVYFERQAEQGGNRTQCDIALVPGHTHAKHIFLAVELLAADDAIVGHRTGVTAGFGTGQGEAGNFFAPGQPRQVVVLLFLGTVVQ